MENYIVINGKKAELTAEQLKALGIATEKGSLFERCGEGATYYYINYGGLISTDYDKRSVSDDICFNAANYCTDKNLMQQRAWHETLSRLLWRYSMEHDGDKIDWKNNKEWKYYIYFNYNDNKYAIDFYRFIKGGDVYFYTNEIAQNAIKEIVEPFIAEHPDFIW